MLIYCEKCKKVLDRYNIVERKMERTLKGVPYSFIGKEAICPDCGTEVMTSETSEFNNKKLYDEYRKEHDLISLEEILSIPNKYHVSKRNISKYLGWGEITFTRYCLGYMPTKQNSDILRKVSNDSEYFKEKIFKYLQDNPTDKSAKRDLNKLIGSDVYTDQNKIYQAAEYIIKKLNKNYIQRLRLMKLLYYVQGFYKSIGGVFMFNDNCEAWRFGPVYPNVRDRFANLEIDSKIYTDNVDLEELDLEDDEKAVIDGVIEAFSKFDNDELIELTHNEIPWLNARKGIPDNARSTNIITKEDIAVYFESVVKDYNIQDATEIIKYTKDKIK